MTVGETASKSKLVREEGGVCDDFGSSRETTTEDNELLLESIDVRETG